MGSISFSGRELPVGLDIGNNQIRAVQLKSADDVLQLHEFGSIDLPEGSTFEGEIVDVQAISDALRRLWKRSKFTGKVVATGISNQQTIFRLVEFPWTEPKDLAEAVQISAQEYIPIPIDEAVLDFAIVGEKNNDAGERVYELMLAAVQQETIDKVVGAVQGAGLKLARVDLTPLAIVRSALGDVLNLGFDDLSGTSKGLVAVLHVSSSTSNIAIVEQGAVRFMRFLPQGGDLFTDALVRELELDFATSERLKREVGLPALDGSIPESLDFDPETIFKAQSILEREANRFINELRLSLEFYQSQSVSNQAVKTMHCSGSGMRLLHLPEYLEKSLKLELIMSDPFNSIHMSTDLQASLGEDRYSYAPAIGLAIGGR